MGKRFPCIRQKDASDCGPAALASVALYHKLPIAVHRLRELAGTDRSGTNLRGVVEAAEKLGFSARAVKGPFEALGEVTLPAIAHWITEEGLGHFVVLYRVAKKAVTVADPGRGLCKLSHEEFQKRWTGYLVLLAPEKKMETRDRGGKQMGPFRRFLALILPGKGLLVEAFFCAILATVLGLSMSYFIQHLVDSVLVHGQKTLLNALAIGMIGVLVFRCLFGVLRQYLLVHLSRKVDLNLLAQYARHVLGQPLRFFESRRVGEIVSRAGDAVKIRQAISGTTLTIIVDSTLVVVSLAVMFLYDWRLALVSCAFIPVLLACVWLHHPAVKRRSREAMEHAAALEAHWVEDVTGVETIKACRAERRRAEEGEERLVRVVQSGFSLQMISTSMGTLGMLLTALAGIVILWVGGYRTMQGALTIGQLMFFYSLLGYMLDPLERLAGANLQVQDALVAMDRMGEVLDLETEKLDEEGRAQVKGIRKGIECRGVSFRYGCRAEVLKGIDLEIPAGKKIAIVGESGCGKSTLLKLLFRFHDPTGGQILLDGMDLRDFKLASLRSKIGMVSQEPFLVNATVRENLALARAEATLDEIVEAARMAGLEEFINSLPQRYETVIGERGMNLSGGQRQRVAIARALVARPEILLFDEATSHLDTETERAIQRSLDEALAGKTVVMVAHRLSTVRDADLIYVMENGNILEKGTHGDLMERGGRYAELWRSQTDEAEEPFVLADSNGTMRKAG